MNDACLTTCRTPPKYVVYVSEKEIYTPQNTDLLFKNNHVAKAFLTLPFCKKNIALSSPDPHAYGQVSYRFGELQDVIIYKPLRSTKDIYEKY